MNQDPTEKSKYEIDVASGELPLISGVIPGTDEVAANRAAAQEDADDFDQEQRDLADEQDELDALHNPPSDPAF